jgi:hypothetical protein
MDKDMKTISEAIPLPVDTLEGEPVASDLARPIKRTPQEQAREDWHVVRASLLKTARRRDAQGVKRLDSMCDAVMDKAIAGNMQAVMFVTERIDGKVVTPVDIKQDITVSSIGEAHLHALQRLTDAVTRQDQATTLDIEVDSKPGGDAV